MRIQNNIMAMNAYRNYTVNTNAISGNLEKLSSGYKVNRAGDDAAGLAISEKMRAQITGLDVAQKNANDGISLVQTAEGALAEVHSMLNRMYELANQSANGTYDDAVDRNNLNKEITALKEEINRISDSANFNGINLLDGTQSDGSVAQAYTTGAFGAAGTAAGDITVTVTYAAGDGSAAAAAAGVTVALALNDTAETVAGKVAAALNKENADNGTFAGVSFSVDGDQVVATSANKGTLDSAALVSAITFADTDTTGATMAAGSVTTAGVDPIADQGLKLQIGDTSESFNQLVVSIGDMDTTALGIASIDISNQSSASSAIDLIKAAINNVSSTRGDLGAIQNRLDHTINNLSVMEENIQNAESAIRDTDVAEEMMAYTKNNILIQSAQAMLAQANQIPQGVLQLLG